MSRFVKEVTDHGSRRSPTPTACSIWIITACPILSKGALKTSGTHLASHPLSRHIWKTCVIERRASHVLRLFCWANWQRGITPCLKNGTRTETIKQNWQNWSNWYRTIVWGTWRRRILGSLCLCVSLCLYVSLSFSLRLCLCLSLSVSLCLSVSVSLCLSISSLLSLFVCLSASVSLSLSLYPS